MPVEIHIEYQGDLHCRAVHGPSHQVLQTDAPIDNGGKGEAFSPTDLVATALGACLLTIMGLVAQRQGLDLNGVRVRVLKEMVSTPVRRIGSLKASVLVPPSIRLTEADRSRLEAAARACPVKQSLHPEVRIDLEFLYQENQPE